MFDALCREAAGCEHTFWAAYHASKYKDKRLFEHHACDFRDFQRQRVEMREMWYYIASSHHFYWEEDRQGGPVLDRIARSICRALGGRLDHLCLTSPGSVWR
jgi:hypothetical protein